MAERTVSSMTAGTTVQSMPRPVPTLGMRGGLGKTLLIAFLLLTIVPLSLLAFLTYHQIQADTREKVVSSLETTVALKEAHLVDWARSYQRELSLMAGVLGEGTADAGQLAALQSADPSLTALVLTDLDTGQVLATSGAAPLGPETLRALAAVGDGLSVVPSPAGIDPWLLAVSHAWGHRRLIALPSWTLLQQLTTAHQGSGEGVTDYLVTGNGWTLSDEGLASVPALTSESTGAARSGITPGISELLAEQNGSGAYTNLGGVPVFGAYRWNPELRVGILAEQPQREALAVGDTRTALLVGATLAVALVASAFAAIVTRHVTRPIVQLTESAAWMARGDLDQKVMVDRTDEIGALARAFNRMAADLRVLYSDLESRVAQRTKQLEEANEQTRYYVMQLATSAEVARVATSIRELDALLTAVVRLIGRAFELHHASIYLLDDSGEWVVAATAPSQAGSDDPAAPAARVNVGGATLVGRVAADGVRRVLPADKGRGQGGDGGTNEALPPPVACELAVPLRTQDRILGILDLQSSRPNDFDEDEQVLYQSLADQICIAIENARAYAVERETVERLQELDRIQARFLTNMSHALRTPLTSIIGFSRVLLKELDGPLNEVQRADLAAIHESGRQLLGLINDMLELSHLELGTAAFSPSEVDLAEIVEGVMATTRALARDKPIQVYEEVPASLPTLYTDGQRVRQVILALLSNAVKFTEQGSIHLHVAHDDRVVTISVSDSGVGIPREERERIFADTRSGEQRGDGDVPGFGLAISKRVVEKLGGQIWVESAAGSGSTFTFTLPIRPIEVE
jgi:signal transduction histidine kinase